MAQDHNDIYSIVERLAILEGRITPTSVKHGLNSQQRSVPQMPALFKAKTQKILGGDPNAKNPMSGYAVGGCEEDINNEDVLNKVQKSLHDYLKNVSDEKKPDADLKDKKRDDRGLRKKEINDRDLIAKESKELDEDHRQLEVGDRICVTGPNHYEGEFGEVVEFAPSGKFVIVRMDNGDEASMHISDVEFHDDQEDEEDWEDDQKDLPSDHAYDRGESPYDKPEPQVESAPVKTVTNECGLWEVHGNEPSGFEIRHGNRAIRSKFKTIEECEIALEMFAAHKKATNEAQDYIDEA